MTRQDITALRDKVRQEAERITAPKSREYTRGNEDALHNFKHVGLRLGLPPHQVLSVYFYKHLDALLSMADGSADFDALSESPIGRAADAHNYLDLLFGLIAERMTPEQRARWGMAPEAGWPSHEVEPPFIRCTPQEAHQHSQNDATGYVCEAGCPLCERVGDSR